MRIFIFILAVSFAGCSSLKNLSQRHDDAVLSAKSESDRRELEEIQALLEQEKFTEAQKSFVEFQKKHPQSYYVQSSRLGEAEALLYLDQADKSIEICQSVQEQTHRNQPEISALAMYRISYAYEAASDEEKAITSLLSAEKHAEYLPEEIIKAEIPARLAVLYNKIGKIQVAESYLQKANIGVRALESGPGTKPSKSWFARMYFQMGQISTQQLTPENLKPYARSQLSVQKFLLRAIDLQDELWSARALSTLIKSYQSFWQLTQNMPLIGGLDPAVAKRKQRQSQVEAASLIIEMSKQAKLWRPFHSSAETKWQKDLYTYLVKLDEKANALLYSSIESTILTEESKQINGLKRAGQIREEDSAQKESTDPTPQPNQVPPTQDPNL